MCGAIGEAELVLVDAPDREAAALSPSQRMSPHVRQGAACAADLGFVVACITRGGGAGMGKGWPFLTKAPVALPA